MKNRLFTIALIAGSPVLFAKCGLPPPYYTVRPCECQLYFDVDAGIYNIQPTRFHFGELLSNTSPASGVLLFDQFRIGRERQTSFYPRFAAGVEIDNSCWNPCWAGTNLFFEVGFFYVHTDRHRGPGDGAVSNFALPFLDGSGDIISSLDAEITSLSGVAFKRRYRYSGVQTKLGSDLFIKPNASFMFTPFLEFDADSVQQIYNIDIGSFQGAVNAINFHLDEHLSTQYYDFGLGFITSWTPTPECQSFFGFLEGAAFVSSTHTYFKGFERVTHLPLTPLSLVASSLRAQHVTVSGKARGIAGIGYTWRNFSLALVGQIDYWSYLPRIANPDRVRNASVGVWDHPVHIEHNNALNWALYLEATVMFF